MADDPSGRALPQPPWPKEWEVDDEEGAEPVDLLDFAAPPNPSPPSVSRASALPYGNPFITPSPMSAPTANVAGANPFDDSYYSILSEEQRSHQVLEEELLRAERIHADRLRAEQEQRRQIEQQRLQAEHIRAEAEAQREAERCLLPRSVHRLGREGDPPSDNESADEPRVPRTKPRAPSPDPPLTGTKQRAPSPDPPLIVETPPRPSSSDGEWITVDKSNRKPKATPDPNNPYSPLADDEDNADTDPADQSGIPLTLLMRPNCSATKPWGVK